MRKRKEMVTGSLGTEQTTVDDKVLKGDIAGVVYNQARLAIPGKVYYSSYLKRRLKLFCKIR